MANLEYFKLLIFGETKVDFSFEVDGKRIKRISDIDLLVTNIESKLDFDKHVSTNCEKANKQVQVIKRFRNQPELDCIMLLYNFPFNIYCSDVWHFCGIRNSRKLGLVKKRALHSLLGDVSSTYPELLTKASLKTPEDKSKYNMMVTLYKFICQMASAYLCSLFQPRPGLSRYGLRGQHKMKVSDALVRTKSMA